MGKFEEIVDQPWTQMTLFAESIPHLLHWDLAYLWILEKQQAVRPDKWKERVEAWKYLLSMLLMDRLRINQVAIDEPLINYTEPFGIESVHLLELDGFRKPIGVLSPIVLVRALPDYKRTNLDEWKQIAEDPSSQDAQRVNHLLQLTVNQLNQQDESSFAGRLARCILNEFNPAPTGNPPNTKSVQFSFLNRISWSQRGDDAIPNTVPLLLHGEGHGDYWLPQCSCGIPLTRAQNDPPVQVKSDIVSLNCLSCNNVTDVSLSDFLVWRLDTEQDPRAILWSRDRVTSIPPKGFPPEPEVRGSEIEFRWQAGALGAQPNRQFLKLSFPNRTIVKKTIADLCYSKLLVAGSISPTYPGIPFRANWIHALTNIQEIRAEVDTNIPTITYRNVEIRGLPVPVDLIFGQVMMSIDEKIAVGLYPDPAKMPKTWNMFRAFVAGPGRDKYSVKSKHYRPIIEWVAESDLVPLGAFSIEAQDGETGATFYIPPREEKEPNEATPVIEINVGIDFGTTNTLVYVAPPDAEPTHITAEGFAIRPGRLDENVLWLAMNARGTAKPAIDFLPEVTFGESRVDPYLIPTAVWVAGQTTLIRWRSTPPKPSFKPDARFKSNPQSAALRLQYLRELLFLTLPAMAGEAAALDARVRLNLGFSFPLAFGFREREGMRTTLQQLITGLEKQGIEADCVAINESRACVRAFGIPRLNQHFLVADMGGGTLDLAFFTTTEDQDKPIMHQIGSLRYAGEDYVESFASNEAERWKVRDAIANGDSSSRYGRDSRAQKLLQQFVGFAFEYLRTMLLAFKREREDEAIKLVLVGNGWHLANAFTSDQRSPQEVFRETYEYLAKQLGVDGLELYFENPLPALPSSKHLVAMGALRNVWRGQAARELDSPVPSVSKLPAGRGMSLGTDGNDLRLYWHDLIGEGVPLNDFTEADLKADSVFFFSEMPELAKSWQQYFLKLLGSGRAEDLPHLDENEMREEIYEFIRGAPPKVGKGPLQVILEQSWKRKLVG